MIASFSKEQVGLLKKVGVRTDFNSDMSADEVEEFVDNVSEYMQLHGISENGLNEEGQMCEDILNLIADI